MMRMLMLLAMMLLVHLLLLLLMLSKRGRCWRSSIEVAVVEVACGVSCSVPHYPVFIQSARIQGIE
jgi:ABC-type branched-subunit amino acid transport system permease subunit